MVEMKADGKSLRAIATAVAGQGYKITHSGVARILKKLRAQAAVRTAGKQVGL